MKWKSISFATSMLFGIGLVLSPVTSIHADGIPYLTAGQSGIPRMDVVDVASYQGNLTVNDYKIMKSYGVKGVIVKLTEGTNYKNPYAQTQITNAKAAGLTVGAYHYSQFNSESGARDEANYFASAARSLGLGNDVVMADDLEDSATKHGNIQANVMAFANQLKSNGYHRPILYTYQSYVSSTGLNPSAFGDSNIWMASYPYAPSSDNLWFTNYGMWQFNSNSHFPGVSGTFDVNIDYKNVMTSGDTVMSSKSVLKVGTINQNGRNDGIYEGAPWNVSGTNFWEYANKFNGMHVLFDQEAKTSNTNNVTWGSWLQTSGIRAYVDEGAVSGLSDVQSIDVNGYFSNGSTGRNDGVYKTSPNNFLDNQYLGTIKSQGLDGKAVHVSKQIKIDGMTWYGATLNGQLRWFDSRAITVDNNKKSVDYSARIQQSGRNDGLYANRPWTFDGTNVGSASLLNNQDVEITSEWTTKDGVTWVAFKYDGKTVHMDSRGIKKLSNVTSINKKIYIDQSAGRNDAVYADSPWNFVSGVWYKPAKELQNGTVINVTKKMNGSNGTIWYGFSYGGRNLWIDANGLVAVDDAIKTTDYSATIKQDNRNDAIYLEKPWGFGATWFATAKSYDGKDIEVTSTWRTADGVTWLAFQVDGKTAYIDQRAVSKVADATNESKVFLINQDERNDGAYLNSPWNFTNATWFGSAKSLLDGECVTVKKVLKAGNGVTWYQFNWNGKTIWLDSAAFTPVTEKQKQVDYVAKIDQTNRSDGIYVEAPWGKDAPYLMSAKELNNKNIEVINEWRTVDGVLWVGFKYNGQTVYMDSKGIKKFGDLVTENKSMVIDQSSGRNDGAYELLPWNFAGAKYIGTVKASKLDGKTVQVVKSLTSSNGTKWYGFNFENKLIWLDAKAMIDVTSAQKDVNYTATINQNGRTDGLYLDAPWNFGAPYLGAAKTLEGKDIIVTKEWRTAAGVMWGAFQYEGKTVYLDSAAIRKNGDISSTSMTGTVDQSQRDDGAYLDAPWNFYGSKWAGRVKELGLDGQVVAIKNQMIGGNGVLWYQIELENKNLYWIDSAAIQK